MKLSIILLFAGFALVASHSLSFLKIERSVIEVNSDLDISKFLTFLRPKLSFKLSKEDEEKIATEYFEKHQKNFGRSFDEIEFRKKILLKRFYEVREHNEKFTRGETLFTMELNKFSDLTENELNKKVGTKMMKKIWPSLNETLPPPPEDIEGRNVGKAPKEWNWSKFTVVQAVQDQQDCGSCYAFAGVAAIEGSMCRYFKQCTKLSEQEAMECTRGCEGGWDDLVYDYTKSKGGVAYASNYKYKGFVEKSCGAHGTRVPHSKVKNGLELHKKNAETQKEFLYNYGPLYVAFNVFNSFYSYKGGIYSDCNSKIEGGHAVLTVGYGEENGVKYWIVKNSWGADWGGKGFFKILRGRDCATIESSSTSFPFTE